MIGGHCDTGPRQLHPAFGHRQQQIHRPCQRQLFQRDLGNAVLAAAADPRSARPRPSRPATRRRCYTGQIPPRPPRCHWSESPRRRSSRASAPPRSSARPAMRLPTSPARSTGRSWSGTGRCGRNRRSRNTRSPGHQSRAPPDQCRPVPRRSRAAEPGSSAPPGHDLDPVVLPLYRTGHRPPADPPIPGRQRWPRRSRPGHATRSPAHAERPGNTSPPVPRHHRGPAPDTPARARPMPGLRLSRRPARQLRSFSFRRYSGRRPR